MIRPVLFIVGPTATGKSEIALQLAQKLSGEIISADSMQVYRGMDIGTAKPSLQERALIPHHLIDILNPAEEFSAFHFYERAIGCIEEIVGRNKIPIVVGGTGFYIRSLLEGIHPALPQSKKVRDRYEQEVVQKGLESVYLKLKTRDPARALKIDPRDKKRIIRALEIHEVSGVKPSEIPLQVRPLTEVGFRAIVCGIQYDRQKLYARINSRVDRMIQEGWVDECRQMVKASLSLTAGQAIGYRELYRHLSAPLAYPREKTIDEIKLHTRQFARRQWIWFKKERGITWFEGSDAGLACQNIENHWREQLKNCP